MNKHVVMPLKEMVLFIRTITLAEKSKLQTDYDKPILLDAVKDAKYKPKQIKDLVKTMYSLILSYNGFHCAVYSLTISTNFSCHFKKLK